MIDNKAIFHYLNPDGCWHEGLGDGTLARCEKCGEFWTHTDREPGDWPNPDYTTEHGFFLLLEGLKAKGVEDTDIRIALAEAVMQLIAKDGEL